MIVIAIENKWNFRGNDNTPLLSHLFADGFQNSTHFNSVHLFLYGNIGLQRSLKVLQIQYIFSFADDILRTKNIQILI